MPTSPPPGIRHVVVIGLMGAGKTTTGRALAGAYGWSWRDSDRDIEAATGLTVRELRYREGVDAMHAREAAHLIDALASTEPNVISAAASVVDDPRCRAAMASSGVAVIWLHARPAILAERFDSDDQHRPAYGDHIEAFLADQASRREPLLSTVGAHVIDIGDLTRDEVVARALRTLASIEP